MNNTSTSRGSIYGLYCVCDSCSQVPRRIRYVGLTRRELRIRILQHFADARAGRKSSLPLYRWMLKHGTQNISVSVLGSYPLYDLPAREVGWIAYYRKRGQADLNVTEGGEGAKGFKHTEDAKKRISAYVRSEKSNRARREKAIQNWTKAAYRQKFISNVGSKSPRHTLTDDQVAQVVSWLWRGIRQSEIAARFEVSRTLINNIHKCRTWTHIDRPVGPSRRPGSAKLTGELINWTVETS